MNTKRFVKHDNETAIAFQERVNNFINTIGGEVVKVTPETDGKFSIDVTYSKVPALNGVESVTVLNTNRINKNYEFIQR
ncbi:hypothetical protein BHM04_04855 [Macrococcus sp. IME1552]|nr:hypothetical protein [Macrococcus sp. IME1552]ATD30546.1 hypothetical protein BHM04_04855 [Macrococcus sp. IME1552]